MVAVCFFVVLFGVHFLSAIAAVVLVWVLYANLPALQPNGQQEGAILAAAIVSTMGTAVFLLKGIWRLCYKKPKTLSVKIAINTLSMIPKLISSILTLVNGVAVVSTSCSTPDMYNIDTGELELIRNLLISVVCLEILCVIFGAYAYPYYDLVHSVQPVTDHNEYERVGSN